MCYVVHRRRWCYRRGVLLSHRNSHHQHHYHHQHQQWCYRVGYGGNLSQAVAPVLGVRAGRRVALHGSNCHNTFRVGID